MIGYSETIRRWAMKTERAGTLTDADGVGEVGLDAGERGRRLAVRFTVRCRNELVEDVRFQVFGCGFTIAACAVAADLAVGRSFAEVSAIEPAMIDRILGGLPSERGYCAVMAVNALQAAVKNARGEKHGEGVEDSAVTVAHEHGPALSADDPVYQALMASPAPAHAPPADRHLFACLLSMAAKENCGAPAALGLTEDEMRGIFTEFFPAADSASFVAQADPVPGPTCNDEVLEIILAHVPKDETGQENPVAGWLARILEARSRLPGHLWVAMGLFERPELTAAIRRHLPTLAAANSRNMRWKRYLFKQVCEKHGGSLCPSPDCGTCSDYALCFAPEE